MDGVRLVSSIRTQRRGAVMCEERHRRANHSESKSESIEGLRAPSCLPVFDEFTVESVMTQKYHDS